MKLVLSIILIALLTGCEGQSDASTMMPQGICYIKSVSADKWYKVQEYDLHDIGNGTIKFKSEFKSGTKNISIHGDYIMECQ